jgi:transcriptional regulator with XRE-family HTH domain
MTTTTRGTALKLQSKENEKSTTDSAELSTTSNKLSALLAELEDQSYREAYVEAHAKDTVAFQLRQMRKALEWEQKDIAAKLGNPKLQPMISRYENPDYGKYSVTTLLELARVFDVALIVRFARFSELLRWDLHKTSNTLQPPNFANDTELRGMQTESWMWRHEARTPVSVPLEDNEPATRIVCITDDSSVSNPRFIRTGSTYMAGNAA